MDKSLLVTMEYPPQKGGVANYLEKLFSRLPSDKIMVLAPKTKGDKEFDQQATYPIIRTNMLAFYVWPRWLPLYFKVKKMVKQNRIKMLHLSHVLPIGYIAYRLNQQTLPAFTHKSALTGKLRLRHQSRLLLYAKRCARAR